ncbi:MAG: 3-hydroxyacyl-[acyl-carrier-protein] dehydratase FabZ [Candidatus Firestonebacteria bacterium RIFOXYC2_FULL_39_67]|nr:MAG: 3-hydroxyacyl-[acyl-carrier-protein] dehydratase FabZ [Candidatus Firestonebacteria bacterium RIFOXYD2_FULL_39_29]OGF52801.1 MAG: 3-hydroxyacyl-[acyl-carrier-protein] dehydratase FabZ [Candidatus Firestonebacteria bacterium RifOxyC12_full_39_7]OGF54885.1 MAG: 3-hydroxyacyl-[acyl-carrier-protein] dehydratase FabZ [Candidatus Firestonebacteria bacterium RIFOXYC2_FULL_39_67]
MVDIKGIMALLPHRFPFLLVDRVEIIEEGKKVRGIKNITMNEDCFNGHFPGNPVFPGVLQVEAMAQTGGVMMLRNPALQGKNVLFVSINNVKFRRMVFPGDQLVMEVESTRFGGRIAAMKGKATVDGELVVEADFVCAITDQARPQ